MNGAPPRGRRDTSPGRVVAVALVLLGVSALLHEPHTIFNSAFRNQDFDQHFAWAVQFYDGLRAGDPYPRWMPKGNWGLGEPAMLFYSPLFYYASALVRLATGSTWSAMVIVELVSTWAVGFYCWRLLSRRVAPAWALGGAIGCQAAPMVFMLFHYFNGFAWAANAACFSALLHYLLRDPDDTRWLNVGAAVSIGLLATTHTLSTLMVLICLSPAVFVEPGETGPRWGLSARRMITWGLTVATGLALSAVYLLPALTSTTLISADLWTRDFRPHNAFAFPTFTTVLYGMRWFSFQWPVAVYCLVASLAGAAILWRARRTLPPRSAHAAACLLLASGVALFLSSELSFPLWNVQSPLLKVQFPHRFLFVPSIAAVLSLTIVAGAVPDRRAFAWPLRGAALLIAAGVALSVGLGGKISLRDGERLSLSDASLQPYGSYGEYTLPQQTRLALEYQRGGGWPAEQSRTGVSARAMSDGSGGYRWTIVAPARSVVVLPVLWFPAWAVVMNGTSTPPRIDAPTGLIQIEVPAGTSEVAVEWRRLPVERVGAGISLAAILVVGIAAAAQLRRARPARD